VLIAPPPLAPAGRDASHADDFCEHVDGVPFTKDNHRTLGRAMAQHVKTMLPVDQEER
jgi:hypothetical protein